MKIKELKELDLEIAKIILEKEFLHYLKKEVWNDKHMYVQYINYINNLSIKDLFNIIDNDFNNNW